MDFILNPNLVLYLPLWKLDGSSFMSKDAYGHLCTVTGALWQPDGRYFDGTDDDISCGTNIALASAARGTVEFWIKFSTAGTEEWFLEIRETTFTDYLAMRREAGNTLHIKIEDGNVTVTTLATVETITDTGFHHIVATQDGTGAKIYLDGIVCSVTGTNSTYWTAHLTTLSKVFVGKAANWGVLEGWIGEVRIYNRALTPTEIQNIYLATKWRYR